MALLPVNELSLARSLRVLHQCKQKTARIYSVLDKEDYPFLPCNELEENETVIDDD